MDISGPLVEVLEPGPLALVEDLGRPGYAHLGVGASGAADQASLRLASRLVGNPESAACVEATFGGLALRFGQPATVAVTGAEAPVWLDERQIARNAPVLARAGQVLRVGAPTMGVRSYVAVRGGLDVPPLLGSRSHDMLAGLGPPRLRAGDRLRVGGETMHLPNVDVAPVARLPEVPELRLVLGPRLDWFTEAAVAVLAATAYEVSAESNRVGIRLSGQALSRRGDRDGQELPPEGMVTGALQVPPTGQPVLFLADHPVTGGYPVIGVVAAADLPLAAQARPGQRLRFRITPPPAGAVGGAPASRPTSPARTTATPSAQPGTDGERMGGTLINGAFDLLG